MHRTIHLGGFFVAVVVVFLKNNGHNVCEDLEREEQASIRPAFLTGRPPTREFGSIIVG